MQCSWQNERKHVLVNDALLAVLNVSHVFLWCLLRIIIIMIIIMIIVLRSQAAQSGGVRGAAPDGWAEGQSGLCPPRGRAGLGQAPQPPAPHRQHR